MCSSSRYSNKRETQLWTRFVTKATTASLEKKDRDVLREKKGRTNEERQEIPSGSVFIFQHMGQVDV